MPRLTPKKMRIRDEKQNPSPSNRFEEEKPARKGVLVQGLYTDKEVTFMKMDRQYLRSKLEQDPENDTLKMQLRNVEHELGEQTESLKKRSIDF